MAKRKYILFDWELKRLFCEKANFEIVEGLLSVLLNDRIKIVEILDSESNEKYCEDRFNRLHVLAKIGSGELVIIEVQNDREWSYFHRMRYGVSKAVVEHIKTGEPYAEVKKIYSVNILYFEVGQGQDYLYHGTTDFRGVFKNDTLKLSVNQAEQFKCKEVSELYPEYYILRVENFDKKETVTPLDEWFLFLKTHNIPEGATAPGLQEASERLRYYRMTEEEQQEYDYYTEILRYQKSLMQTHLIEGRAEGRIEGKIEGIAEERERGEAQRKEDKENIVLNLLQTGLLTIEMISVATGISQSQIEELKKRFGL